MALQEAVARVLEAKFLSESADAVGAETSALVLRQDGNIQYLGHDRIERYRAKWSARNSKIPRSMLDILELGPPSAI